MWLPVVLLLTTVTPVATSTRTALLDTMAGLANREPAAALDAGRSHHPIFVDPLRALLRDPDSAVRTAAATALGEIGVPRASHDLNALIRSLEKAARGEDDRVAQAALHALSVPVCEGAIDSGRLGQPTRPSPSPRRTKRAPSADRWSSPRANGSLVANEPT